MSPEIQRYDSGADGSSSLPQVAREGGSAPGSEFDLHQVGAMFWRRRWTLIGSVVSVIAIAAVLTYIWPRTYESTGLFLVEKDTRGAAMVSSALSLLEKLGKGGQTETEVELLLSRRVVEPVVDRLDLHVEVEIDGRRERPEDVFASFGAIRAARPGEYRFEARGDGGYRIIDAETDRIVLEAERGRAVSFAGLSLTIPDAGLPEEVTIRTTLFPRAVNNVLRRIGTSTVQREANLIELTCRGPTIRTAHDLCAEISDSYLMLRTDLHREEASLAAKFLKDQVDLIEARLLAAEDSFELYARSEQVVALDKQASEAIREYTELNMQREQLHAERTALAELIRGIDEKRPGGPGYRDLASFPTFIRQPAVGQMLTSLVELDNRRSQLALSRSDSNPDLLAVDQRIRDLEGQLRSLAIGYEEALGTQIRSIDEILARADVELSSIPAQQVQLARLTREVKLLEELYRLLETRRREAEVAKAVELPSVRIVDRASWPFKPSSPNVPLNIGLALILGMGMGIVIALYREELHTRRVRGRREVESDTGLPVLGMVPLLRHPGPVLSAVLEREGQAPVRLDRPPVVPMPRRISQAIWSRLQVAPPADDRVRSLEAFRSIATDLNFVARYFTARLRTLAVTSSGPAEGKTFTACNLAMVRANHGVRTLLIDADMRMSEVAQFFGIRPSRPGLSEVLQGAIPLEEAYRRIRVGGTSHLTIVTAGTPTRHSSGLLESDAFPKMLERAAEQFDLVIIDTPPINVITDSATIAAAVDATMIVARGGVTDREALTIAVERLRRAGGRTAGVVLNGVELPEQYGYYNYGNMQPAGTEHA